MNDTAKVAGDPVPSPMGQGEARLPSLLAEVFLSLGGGELSLLASVSGWH